MKKETKVVFDNVETRTAAEHYAKGVRQGLKGRFISKGFYEGKFLEPTKGRVKIVKRPSGKFAVAVTYEPQYPSWRRK